MLGIRHKKSSAPYTHAITRHCNHIEGLRLCVLLKILYPSLGGLGLLGGGGSNPDRRGKSGLLLRRGGLLLLLGRSGGGLLLLGRSGLALARATLVVAVAQIAI